MAEVNLRVAAKAAIVHNGKVLILREAHTYDEGSQLGKYGLPGGRINPDESFFDALAREVAEETGLKVKPIKPLYVGEWWPDIKGVSNHIVAIFVLCEAQSDKVRLSEEHDHFEWIDISDCNKYSFMQPDDKVVITALQEITKKGSYEH